MDAINPATSSAGYPALTNVSGTDPSSAPAPTPILPPQQPPQDTVQISAKGTKAAQYVKQAQVIAPLDAATVKKLKEAVAQGKYPPPAIVAGLVNLIGNNLSAVVSGD